MCIDTTLQSNNELGAKRHHLITYYKLIISRGRSNHTCPHTILSRGQKRARPTTNCVFQMRGNSCEHQSGVELKAEPVELEDMESASGELTRNQYQGLRRLNVCGIQ